MKRQLWLVMAVLTLSACQAKKSEVADAPVPVTAVASLPSSTPTVVTEPLAVKQVETVVAAASPPPVVVASTPVVEPKPTEVVTPQPVVAPVVISKSVTPTVVKPAAPAATKVVTASFSDADGIALGKKRNCFACHMIDKKIVGPAWKDVAAKYRGDAGAQARMEAKIGKGGSGAWGSMAMPAQPQVTADERAILARFILNLK